MVQLIKFTIPTQISGYLRYGHVEGELTHEDYIYYCELKNDQDRKEYLIDCGELVIDSYRIEDVSYEEPEFAQKCVNATDRCEGSFPCPYCGLDFKDD